jgi:hypothetical protein
MYKYEVGKLYNPNQIRWQEAVQFNIRDGQCELLMFFKNPSIYDVMAVKKAVCEFGVLKIENVIFFLYKFGTQIDWSDQPFSIHLVPENERELPELTSENSRLTLQIILTDAGTGKIKALRMVSLSPEFSTALLNLTKEQINEPFDSQTYDRTVDRIYTTYPATTDLLKECFEFSTGGI